MLLRRREWLTRYYRDQRVTVNVSLFLFAIFYFFLVFILTVYPQPLRTVTNTTFQGGEFLKYRVFYDSWLTSWLTAGFGTMKVDDTDKKFNGRDTWHITVEGKSNGIFNLFMKVNDRFESYMDREGLYSHEFIRHTREGKFRLDDEVHFDYDSLKATSRRAVKPIPPHLQDIVSAFYYMRNMDFDTAKVNDEYYLNFFLDDSVYHSRIIFLGREYVETALGRFRCLKFKPQVAKGEVFQDPYPMVLWVTDDRNHIPVLGKSAVYVGSIMIELIEYSGLRYPLGAMVAD